MDKIYLIMGECGEYEDYKMWPVKAFAFRRVAVEYAVKLQTNADVLHDEYMEFLDTDDDRDFTKQNELDPECDVSQEATYFIKEIPFDESEA